jgi:hypothetical protein
LEEASAATSGVRESKRSLWQSLLAAHRAQIGAAALWLAFGTVLAVLTTRVVDWYVMTDELLYERLAISIAQLHSPLPQIHGELIGNVNQLYPLLLAPLFHDTLVPSALHDAHVLNALVMSSASIPAYLLARRVTQSTRLSYFVAVLSVCIPWIALSSLLMTEVVAYPVFLWAALALQHAVAVPGARNDLLLVVALIVATLARTQFAILIVVLPPVLLIHHFVFARASSLARRARAAVRDAVSAHRELALAYAALIIAALALLAAGRLSSALGTYSVTAEGDLLPKGMGRSLLEHLAPIGLGLGILPFILGSAWLLTAVVMSRIREQHAFASLATVTIVALLVEVTSYDLRFGQGRLHDRYLFYVVPLLLIAFAAGLQDRRWSRWSLFASTGLLAMAFAVVPVIRYQKFNVDSPVAVLNDVLLDLTGSVNGARLLLAFTTIGAALLFLLASAFLHRRQVAVLLLALAALTIPAQTGLAFNRLLTVDGTSGRPITLDQGVVFDWIDRELGPTAKVTMIPYPFLYGNYWENVAYWWNVEFWNASVQRAAVYEGAFTGTPETFPPTELSFDRSTGRANVSPSAYSVQAVAETRFRLAGEVLGEDRGVTLVRTQQPWRAEWLAFDLYRDGWTVPRVVGTIRVFAAPGQTGSLMRFLTVSVRGPRDVAPRDFQVTSNASDWHGLADEKGTSNQISVCVPAQGFADVRIDAPRYSPIYGDPRSEASFVSYARSGGVLVTGIALADEQRAC